MAEKTSSDKPRNGQATVIKKYANRRLYDTASSAYVTLEYLAQLVKDGEDFVVQDAKTGDDITRTVLTQIILEQESRGDSILPMNFLRQMIRFYGDSVQAVLPAYLDMSMDSFTKSQERFRSQLASGMSGINPLAAMNPMNPMSAVSGGANLKASMRIFEDQIRANMSLFDETLKAWGGALGQRPAPAATDAEAHAQAQGAASHSSGANAATTPERAGTSATDEDDTISELKRELRAMRSELAELKKFGAGKNKN